MGQHEGTIATIISRDAINIVEGRIATAVAVSRAAYIKKRRKTPRDNSIHFTYDKRHYYSFVVYFKLIVENEI